ncbi:GspE/PulE family protein [Massilia horti]|uniref:Type II/IV secretion system protein n=1 Tax=Massilia horti TaxID=2562153 RepID=A0A4Y9T0K4_9BURK|nr:GspE/PulE family protein [Massilia horti]TFW32309.1 type II/IV secretion system protein [Massilia horti]
MTAAFTREQLRAAMNAAAGSGRSAAEELERASGLDAAGVAAGLAHTLGLVLLGRDELARMQPAFDLVPFALASAHNCVALYTDIGAVLLATADPLDPQCAAWAGEQVGVPFSWAVVARDELAGCLARHEASLRALDSVAGPAGVGAAPAECAPELSLEAIGAATSPVVRLVDSTLYDALKAGASDIHFESSPAGLAIKYRIDGALTAVGSLDGAALAAQALSRVKVMAELDIAERRVPQDGRFRVSVRGREVDFRVSVMPSMFGEDAVLRVLDKQVLSDQMRGLRLDVLGFDGASVGTLRRLSRVPYGMLLVTGPTGSGKTTTLYAALAEIHDGAGKIITIEDPVEYQLPGVLQIPVNEKKGLTFARGLRSILRHDPDKIMVGEIRDPETAQIAVQSALTGHLVFTTVHANSVFDVIGRFLHMGVDPYSFVAALNGVLAQRLVRVNCRACAVPVCPPPGLVKESGQAASMDYRAGTGCTHCRGTGFKGRKAIGELLVLNDELRELIAAREPARRVREAARGNGTRLLRDAALALAASGETTLEEIDRVTFAGQ